MLQPNHSMRSMKLDRFCLSILPRIDENIKSLVVESAFMKHILGAGNYPNLTELTFYDMDKKIASQFFTDNCMCKHKCKQQITNLTLVINESDFQITSADYTQNVYSVILSFFVNLKHLTIVVQSIVKFYRTSRNYPCLSLHGLPTETFYSSTLTKLSLNVIDLNDVYALLDGHLKQLTTFSVEVEAIQDPVSISNNHVSSS
ncbi:unnamed protein product [Adineta ricciae]|uniref:Uncharacterized protein n=1 Tax=Adineta ricciae TaxID=249248 RepID=A0A815DX51_ADIRI|nr:unnamed protein product [Adineta ricciae]